MTASLSMYLKQDFLFDLFTMFPFYQLFYKRFNKSYLLYLIKVLKFKSGFGNLEAEIFITNLREYTKYRALRMVKINNKRANDKKVNRTYISQLVYILQILKVVESFVWLFSFGYFLGVLWYILCDLQDTFWLEPGQESFIVYYNLEEKQGTSYLPIAMTYYISTTLTTIGLGDFHPKTNAERLTCALIMISGVAMFSIIH